MTQIVLKNKSHVQEKKSCLVKNFFFFLNEEKQNKGPHHNSRKSPKKSNFKPMCKLHMDIFVIQPSYFLFQVFSPFWRKFFGGSGEKIPGPYNLFFFFPTQPNTLQKSFFFLFSFQNFPSTLFYLQTNIPLMLTQSYSPYSYK